MSSVGVSANRLEILQIADAVAREKSIEKELVITAMEHALQKAARSRYGAEHDIRATIDPKTGDEWKNASRFPEAAIPFTAEFYFVPTNKPSYFSVSKGKATPAFTAKFKALKNPVFMRNIAVRR